MRLLLFLAFLFPSYVSAKTSFEIVESVPVETVYGSTLSARTQAVWLDMIKKARKTLDIGAFYFSSEKGHSLEPVIEAIKSAARRGVAVRIIADSVFYAKMPEVPAQLMKVKNVSVRIIPFAKLYGGVMHAKYLVADGETVFAGSQNFDWRALEHIHEVGLRVDDAKIAKAFLKIFESDWNAAAAGKKPACFDASAESGQIRAVFSPKGNCSGGWEIDELIKIIDGAKRSVWAQVMTYSLSKKGGKWRDLDDALRRAGARGVDVRLVFTDWALSKKSAAKDIDSLARTSGVSVKISVLPPWSGGPVDHARVEHCKYLVADGAVSWVSTSNWDYSYFYQCRGAAFSVQIPSAAKTLEDIFLKTWNGPYVTAK